MIGSIPRRLKVLLRVLIVIASVGFVVIMGMMPRLRPEVETKDSEVNKAMPDTKVFD